MSNMVVNTNVLALNSHRALKGVGKQQAAASAKLSSGLRINKASDDAAGLAISEKMRSQIKGLNQASRNSQDGQSMIQVAEGALSEVSNMVQRTQELTTQAANGTNTIKDREKLAAEMTQLSEEIVATSTRVEFNGKKILDASKTEDFIGNQAFQVGANTGELLDLATNTVIAAFDLTAVAAVINTAVTEIKDPTKGPADISAQIDLIKDEVDNVTTTRAELGAYDNRLDYTVKALDLMSENLSTAESRIRDTDMAKEMMNLQKANVLQQAATSMLSQANQGPQNILQLLR